MNGWSSWKHHWHRLATRLAAGSLGMSLGLASFGLGSAAVAQTSLPPYPPTTRADSVAATPAIWQKDAPTPRPENPAPAPAPIAAEPAATCAAPTSGGGLFHPWTSFGGGSCGSGGCRSGGCGAGGCGSGGCGSGGCGSCVNDTCGPQACYGCGFNGCYPGHKNCCPTWEGCGPVGRFWSCFYHCLCCPDPCYEPRYIVEANSAFWVDGARPVTMTRVRYDAGQNFTQPDRSEFYWARAGGGGKGPKIVPNRLDYSTLSFYQEAAAGKASLFIETPYTSVSPDIGPQTSGFGDMNIGTKALLFDCELMQVTFQFRTYLPVGNAGKGLGTGHVSLEPSLLTSIKLLPETYLQGQLSEWIPIAADPAFGGSVLHYHASLNHVLYRCQPDMPIIGTLEMNGYSFQDGLYSVPGGLPVQSSGGTWVTAGPGIRTSICNRLDFGVSAVWGLGQGGPEQIYRTEVRFRF